MYHKEVLVLVALHLIFTPPVYSSCPLNPGVHCDASLSDLQDSSCSATDADGIYSSGSKVFSCVKCFFPNNCEENNTCGAGTTGPTCERCLQAHEDDATNGGYYRVGSSCSACSSYPVGALILGGLILLVIVKSFTTGFSVSVVTKVKLFIRFSQSLLLAGHLRIRWPSSFLLLYKSTTFSLLSSDPFTLECYIVPPLPSHYLSWLTSLGSPSLILILGWLMDKHTRRSLEAPVIDIAHQKTTWIRLTQLRRFSFLVLVWSFISLCLTFIHTQSCVSSVPANVVFNKSVNLFLYNQEETNNCEKLFFQCFSFFGGLFLFFVVLILPIFIIFFTLVQRKWEKLNSHFLLHGVLYESFKERYCFWEGVALLKMLALVAVTEIYPFRAIEQTALHASVTLIYLLVTIISRPYRPCKYNTQRFAFLEIHNSFEVVANLAVLLVQVNGIIIATVPDLYTEILAYVTIALVILVITFWAVLLLAVRWEKPMEGLSDLSPPEGYGKASTHDVLWRRNKEGEVVDLETLNERAQNLAY